MACQGMNYGEGPRRRLDGVDYPFLPSAGTSAGRLQHTGHEIVNDIPGQQVTGCRFQVLVGIGIGIAIAIGFIKSASISNSFAALHTVKGIANAPIKDKSATNATNFVKIRGIL
jgi:hypothetical protein